jgi:hypothetical protein
MPLPVGTWSINANGNVGTLVVSAVSSGTFNGTVLGQPFSGFFDETDQEFAFIRVTGPNVSTFEVYHGTLFTFSPTVGTVVYTLGGTFRSYPPAGAVSPFEWLAQLSQKLKEKEGKDGKDKEASKDTKDLKDRKEQLKEKEHKEGVKEKEHVKELELAVPPPATDVSATIEQLAQRLTAVEQALAVGQAFISPSERPVVGTQATGER